MIYSLKLDNFRNFVGKNLKFSEQITVILGENGVGKTNILESLFLLSTGKSFKARTEMEMIRYDQELARISGTVASSMEQVASEDKNYILPTTKLEVVLTEGVNGWPKKRLLINSVPKRIIDFSGIFKTVLFGPWDMDLVTESPSVRRKFLDSVLSQVDREYRRSILSYEQGLRQRNRLLFRIREEGIARSQLLFWNQLLIKNGDYISKMREEFIEYVNIQPGINKQKLEITYDKSAISEARLEQYAREEVASATTLVGPHRDDFIFIADGRELAKYGSRGQQRMSILWLKLAELNYIEKLTGERPTLLLDDIFSELDHAHRDIVMEVTTKQQTIITTADEHFLEKNVEFSTIKL